MKTFQQSRLERRRDDKPTVTTDYDEEFPVNTNIHVHVHMNIYMHTCSVQLFIHSFNAILATCYLLLTRIVLTVF